MCWSSTCKMLLLSLACGVGIRVMREEIQRGEESQKEAGKRFEDVANRRLKAKGESRGAKDEREDL